MTDKDWSEIRSDFDQIVNSETLRKAGVGIKQASDADMIRTTPSTSMNALSNGFVDRQKLRDLQNKVNEIYRSESRSELMRETISESIKKLPYIEVRYAARFIGDLSKNRELVLALGDIHYGADIHVEGLNGDTINKFNSEVFEIRMEKLLDETVDIITKYQIQRVHVFFVGDLLDGMLRQSQLMRLEYGLVDSTMYFSEYMAKWLAELSRYTNEVDVYAASGNHSEVRPLKSKKREFSDENMERIVMWFLEARLRESTKITIHADCKKYVKADVLGYSFLLLHGDSEKDIQDVATETIRLYKQPIDFFVCGHKHRENEYPSGSTPNGDSIVIRTPSICGTDSYANSKGYCGRAGATAIVMEKGYGRRCVFPINLQ